MINKIEFGKQRSWIQKLFGIIVCASMALSSVAASPFSPQPQAETPLPGTSTPAEVGPTDVAPTAPNPAAPVGTSAGASGAVDPSRVNYHQIVVKFTEQSGQVSALSGESNPLLGLAPDAALQPLFQNDAVNAMSADGSQEAPVSDIQVPGTYYFLQLPDGKTYEEASATLEAIKNLDGIETAYMEPYYSQAVDPADMQTYLDDNDLSSAHNGIQASTTDSVWDITGGHGVNQRVTVVDYGWDADHQDLSISNSWGTNNDTRSIKNHGTAVLGILGGKGMTINGIVPDAQLQISAPSITVSVAQAIYVAASHSRSGDVIVIPLEVLDTIDRGFECPTDCICTQGSLPVEYTSAVYDVIKSATANGIIVVEAAGNGAANLDEKDSGDNRIFGTKFQRGAYDSGAILVGAGDSKTAAAVPGTSPAMVVRAPSCFSNYGERLDLQGWGDGIVTTGYGDLEGTDPTNNYTAVFGGTSGATAIVGGAAASLQGIARDRGYVIKPKDMRSFLVDTGTVQGGDPTVKKVGPLPDLKAALDEKMKDEITLISPDAGIDPRIDTLRPTLDWTDFPGADYYGVIVATGNTFNIVVASSTSLSNSQYTLSADLKPNTEYWWKARVMVGGSWKDYTAPRNFKTPDITTIPLTPKLSSPGNSATTADLTPTFTWKAPSTKPDTGYNIQISTEMIFDSATTHAIGDPDTLTYTPGVDLDGDTIYYWRVQSVNTIGADEYYSAWTSWRVLKTAPAAPTGLAVASSPASDDPQGSLRPTITWDEVPYARAYKIKYSNSLKTYTVTIGISRGAVAPPTEYLFTKKLAAGLPYTWYVSVLGRYAWSDYSSSVSSTLYTPPATPTLSTPKNNGIFTSTGFVWKQPAGSAATGYILQISTSSKFADHNPPYVNTFLVDTGDSSLTYPPPPPTLEVGQKYYWRMKSYNVEGVVNQYSEWSKTYLMKTVPPEPATLLLPVDGADLDSLRPTLVWDNVTTAKSFSVKFSYTPTGGAFKTVVASVNLSDDDLKFKYEMQTDLPAGKTIYWKVASTGIYGTSNYTSPLSFNTYYPPNSPVVKTPNNGAVLATFLQKLDWSDATDSTKDGSNDIPITYDLQIDSNNTFDSDGGSPIFKVLDLTSSEYTITEADLDTYLVDAGKYYWRVRSQNSNGMYSKWTTAYSYTTPTLVKGTVFDATGVSPTPALSTRGIPSANVCVVGTSLCVLTEADGTYEIRGLSVGTQFTLRVIEADYINSYGKTTLATGANKQINFGMVEQPADDIVRIVLNWGSVPSELQSHLLLPNSVSGLKDIYCKTGTVVECDYIGDMSATPYAALMTAYNMPTESVATPSPVITRNPTNGYGPVVIDLDSSQVTSGTYRFAVFQKTPAISTNLITLSNANVQIYWGSTNITPDSVIWAPTSGTGLWWKVFDIFPSTLPQTTITKYNSYTSTQPANP